MALTVKVERIGVIGGGIVGMAIARELGRQNECEITVLEKEQRLAEHQTGRNSGVVHAGLYYQPGSLKAMLCARGRTLTREFCAEHALPYDEVGKLVVALNANELPRLAEIERRAIHNQVPGLRRVDADGLREIEPHAAGIAAIHSPNTAIVDYRMITEALSREVTSNGGSVLLSHEVTDINIEGSVVRVTTSQGEHLFDRLVVCAGLQSDVVARMAGAPASPKILPFRGEYWSLAVEREHLVRGMIYPVPDPNMPFLGVHFTRKVHGGVDIGPNAVPALAREGYGWGTVSMKDTWSSLVWPGAMSLARNYWSVGMKEIAASIIKPLYFRQARKFVPELKMADLAVRSTAGVRAQAWDRNGDLLDDFALDKIGPVTLVRNAPSPAATSAMAIAEHLSSQILDSR